MFNLDNNTNKKMVECSFTSSVFDFSCSHNKKCPYIPDHPYRMLVIGCSWSGKANALLTAQKIKFCSSFRQFPADLVTFTEEILNGKLYFLYSGLI